MESNVYVISLDAVDLDLLPITRKARSDEVVPLWTRSNLGLRSSDYYEFKIKTNDDSQPKDPPVIEYMTCDICDIDVPKVYISEHKISFKHKFNKKIADVALKRLQLYMNRQDDADSEYDERDPSETFCPECSIIVDRKDEASHRKSIAHKNSVVLERFLSDFLLFYANDDKLIEEQEAVTETVIKGEHLVHDKKDKSLDITKRDELVNDNTKKDKHLDVRTDKQISNNIIKKDLSVLVSESKVKKNDVLQDLKTDKKPINTTDKQQNKENIVKDPYNISISEYLILLNKKLNTSPMSFKSVDNEIEIKTIDGCRVRVPENNFNGFLAIGSREYCVICQLLPYDLKVHMLSDEHMKFVSLPLEDKHCLRMISNFGGHCLLCNVPFQHTITHRNYSQHIGNLKKFLIFDNLKENEYKVPNVNKKAVESISNDISKVTIANVSKSAAETNKHESATASNKVTVNKTTNNIFEPTVWSSCSDNNEQPGKRFCQFCNVWISVKKVKKHENTMKHTLNTMSDYHYMMKIVDEDNLLCKICDVTVLNNVNGIKKHFVNNDHLKKYNHLLNINNVKKLKGLAYICMICNEIFLHKNEYLHIESKGHKVKISLADESLSGSASNDGIVVKEAVIKTEFSEVKEIESTDLTVAKETETIIAVTKENDTPETVAKENETTVAVAKETGLTDTEVAKEIGLTDAVVAKETETTVAVVKETRITDPAVAKETETTVAFTKENKTTVTVEKDTGITDAAVAKETGITDAAVSKETETHVAVTKENETTVTVAKDTGISDSALAKETGITDAAVSKETETNVAVTNETETTVAVVSETETNGAVAKDNEATDVAVLKETKTNVAVTKENETTVTVAKVTGITDAAVAKETGITDAAVSKETKTHVAVTKENETTVTVAKDTGITDATVVKETGITDAAVSKETETNVAVTNENETTVAVVSETETNGAVAKDNEATDVAVTKGKEITETVTKEDETTVAVVKETRITYAAVAKETKAIDVTVAKSTEKADIKIGKESEKTDKPAEKDKQNESETNYHFCEVCQVKVPSNENNIKIHNTGRPHMRKLGELSNTEKAKAPAKEKTINPNYQISRIDKSTLICRVCFVYLTASEANVTTHIEGASHSNNYIDFLKRNRLIVRNNVIYCTICVSKVVIGNEFSHCLTSQHVDNLEVSSSQASSS